ncbi:MAG: alkaline phosphatase family protein [Candidatus Omnitrophica bacterium]|nr:alkaline phosphatase family protein [Candidatus Omnitrophota bacterium]
MRGTRILTALFSLAILWAPAAWAQDRVLILGFDGADPDLCRQWMEEGHLPNMARVAQEGCFVDLGTSTPPQSPVSWAVFSAGKNPGYTGIFDFLRRQPGSYLPEFGMIMRTKRSILPHPAQRIGVAVFAGLSAAMVFWLFLFLLRRRHRRGVSLVLGAVAGGLVYTALFLWVPAELPWPEAGKKTRSFWQYSADAEVPTVVIQCPATFPAEPMKKGFGRMLSGLGVPDVRGTFGTFSYYSDTIEENQDTEMGGKLVRAVPDENGVIESFVWGPRNETLKERPPIQPPLRIQLDRKKQTATVEFQGQSETLAVGSWSSWYDFKFPMNPLLKIRGIGRFYLEEVSPHFKLYLSPVNIHPCQTPPNVSLSTPKSFSKQLAEEEGLYKTLGWAFDTWALNEHKIDEQVFLEDAYFTFQRREALMKNQLEKRDWQCFVGVYEATDRIQHMFWRLFDKEHPAYDADLAARYGDAIFKVYQEMDRIVGEVYDNYVDENTWFAVVSDHGFHSYRTSVNINTWLVKQGYMHLKAEEETRERNLNDLFDQGEFWPNVDWSRTRAYSLGLAGLYINLQGREPQGIVSVEQYESVCARLIADLEALVDPESEEDVIRKVYRRHEIYSGPWVPFAPDLVVGFQEGYRTSWQTALGGIPAEVFEPNLAKWSGDHCSYDPEITAGMLLSNRKVLDDPHIMDLAPTVLQLVGAPGGQTMQGRVLRLKRGLED